MVEHIEPVFVGSYPTAPLAVDICAGNTCFSDEVVLAKLISQVFKLRNLLRLHEDTLLEQSEPDISIVILYDGVNLTL